VPDGSCRRGQGLGQALSRQRGTHHENSAFGLRVKPRGIVAQQSRAIVVGPIARLELIPCADNQPADNAVNDTVIEEQIPAQQFRDLGFREGETLVVTPRRARVFVEGH